MAGDLGTLVQDIGGAVGDLFTSKGNAAQAADYQGAANLATQNAQLSAASTRIQETQVARSVTQSLGTTQADIAGAGFTMSGSALDILRSSASQGSLATSLVNIQGAINENSYAAQAGAYAGEAKAANEASDASKVNAIASIGGALISGTGQLAQAGKTVVQGYNYIFGGGDSAAAAAGIAQNAGVWVDAAGNSVAEGTAGAIQLSASDATTLAQTGQLPSLLSATDSSISAGASIGTTDVTLDTSSVPLGATTDEVSAGISSGIADFAGVAGGAFAGFQLGSLIGQGTGKAIAQAAGVIVGAVAGAEAVGIPVAAIATAALSVICTAYYKRGMVGREVWLGAQKYGRALDPVTFAGYQYWAAPIAQKITKDAWFAKLVAPVFIPPVNEMAILMGQKNIRRTYYGIFSHRVLLGLSWVTGQIIKGDKYDEARA